jgi:hypothetical protein
MFPDKINFNPRNADKIEALHERVARRLKWVIDTNQGLYLKLGQALGGSSAMLRHVTSSSLRLFSPAFSDSPSPSVY